MRIPLTDSEPEGYRWMPDEEFGAFVRSGSMIPIQKKRFYDHFVSCGYLE